MVEKMNIQLNSLGGHFCSQPIAHFFVVFLAWRCYTTVMCVSVCLFVCEGESVGQKSQATWSFSVLLHFMQILPFYINSEYKVWRFGTASFESTLKAGFPKGTRISSCVNVCWFLLAFLHLCTCPVFVARWAQGHQQCHHCPSFSHPS